MKTTLEVPNFLVDLIDRNEIIDDCINIKKTIGYWEKLIKWTRLQEHVTWFASQAAIQCSKSTVEILKQGLTYVSS